MLVGKLNVGVLVLEFLIFGRLINIYMYDLIIVCYNNGKVICFMVY